MDVTVKPVCFHWQGTLITFKNEEINVCNRHENLKKNQEPGALKSAIIKIFSKELILLTADLVMVGLRLLFWKFENESKLNTADLTERELNVLPEDTDETPENKDKQYLTMQNLINFFYITAHTWSKRLVRRGSRQVARPSVMMGVERVVGHWARHLLLSGGSCSSCRLRRAAVWACRRRGAVALDAAVGSVGRRQWGRLLLPRPGAWVAGRSCVGSAGGVVLFQPQDLGSAKHTPETDVQFRLA